MLPGGQRAHSSTCLSAAPSLWSANLQVQRACARLIVRACVWAALRFVLSEQNATLRPEERSKLLNVSPKPRPVFCSLEHACGRSKNLFAPQPNAKGATCCFSVVCVCRVLKSLPACSLVACCEHHEKRSPLFFWKDLKSVGQWWGRLVR
jgi:hypothetical protein